MGMDDPQSYFKTVCNGLEKHGQVSDYRKLDLEIDENPKNMKRASLTGWLNINTQSSSSEQKLRETSNTGGHKKRPSSVSSSSGAAGGKASGRSFAETHSTTIATNQGVTLTDI